MSLQHLWAEVSEKSSDVLDPTIKYGGGSELWRNFLTQCSELVALYEEIEKGLSIAVAFKEAAHAAYETAKNSVAKLAEHQVPDDQVQEFAGNLEESAREMERVEQKDQKTRRELVRLSNLITVILTGAISGLDELKSPK